MTVTPLERRPVPAGADPAELDPDPVAPAGPPARVDVVAPDPLLRAGAASELDGCAEVTVVAPGTDADVVVLVADEVSDATLDGVRAVRDRPDRPEVVLVCRDVGAAEALRAVVAGVRGLLRRGDAGGDRLARAVVASADGECTVPFDVLDPVLAPPAAPAAGVALSEREQAVLALVADGRDTAEIARELSYSARTITSVLHDVTQRFRLRNRTHAVAYALRAGLL